MKNILISPPFGIYIPSTNYSTSIRGTYTIYPRPGIIKQILKTFRKVKGGYINQMGFRNKGITSEYNKLEFANTHQSKNNPIWSIGAIEQEDWEKLYAYLRIFPNITLELNLGCPNVNHTMISSETLHKFVNTFEKIIVKLPANINDALTIADTCYQAGVKTFHCCNTIKTPKGGISSRQIKPISLTIIKFIHARYEDINIIAGGGIYSKQDVLDYKVFNVSYYSLATIFINKPWNLLSVTKTILSNNNKKFTMAF